MIVIPAGRFRMGCLSDDDRCWPRETPVLEVTFAVPFALSVHEVTFDDYDRFTAGVEEVGDQGWGRGDRPVINVSRDNARAYVRWLAAETGGAYRLPSESEWEYAARAGSTGSYHWGDEIGEGHANCHGCGSPWGERRTAPVGSFAPNPFGLHDMLGNVWEWVEDDGDDDDLGGIPSNGSPRIGRERDDGVVRGGSWGYRPRFLRSAVRLTKRPGDRSHFVGFRVARTLARVEPMDTDTGGVSVPGEAEQGSAVCAGAPAVRETMHVEAPARPTPAPVAGLAGSTFRDRLLAGGHGPEMVVIPAGSYRKGCLAQDRRDGDPDDVAVVAESARAVFGVASPGCLHQELPAHDVTIRHAFAMSVHEVTFEDYGQVRRRERGE